MGRRTKYSNVDLAVLAAKYRALKEESKRGDGVVKKLAAELGVGEQQVYALLHKAGVIKRRVNYHTEVNQSANQSPES